MTSSPLLSMILSMVIYGTIGIFRKSLPVSSAFLSCTRGLLGGVFLLVYAKIKGIPVHRPSVARKGVPMVLSGVIMGLNWVLLFEAYRYVSVATATLCYYMAPVFVLMASPLVWKQRLKRYHYVGIAWAFLGMVLISGIFDAQGEAVNMVGILLGLGAAVLYACVVLLNKYTQEIPSEERTVIQLFAAGLTMVPYVLIQGDIGSISGLSTVLLILLMGILHTGIAYLLYFGSIVRLPAQTVSVISYIDPLVAVLLSALFLHEPLTLTTILGCLCILGASLMMELLPQIKKKGSGT